MMGENTRNVTSAKQSKQTKRGSLMTFFGSKVMMFCMFCKFFLVNVLYIVTCALNLFREVKLLNKKSLHVE